MNRPGRPGLLAACWLLLRNEGPGALRFFVRELRRPGTFYILHNRDRRDRSLLLARELAGGKAVQVIYYLTHRDARDSVIPWLATMAELEALVGDTWLVFETAVRPMVRMAQKYLQLEDLRCLPIAGSLLAELGLDNPWISLEYDGLNRLHHLRFRHLPPRSQYYLACGKLVRERLAGLQDLFAGQSA